MGRASKGIPCEIKIWSLLRYSFLKEINNKYDPEARPKEIPTKTPVIDINVFS